MEYLLRLLLFGRDTLQDSIRETLDRLENTRITQDFRNLTALPQDPGDRAYKRDPFLCSRARHDIRRRIGDLVRFEEALQDPESKEGHHEMRIAAKRLRYTMEVYSPLLEGELMPAIITMRNFQDALGELHDTDVWIGLLPRFLEEGQSFPGNAGEQSQLTALIEPGILHLLRECRATRTRQYAKALGQWKEIRAEKTIEGIQAVLLPGAEAQKAMQPERKSGGDKKRLDQVVRVAENYRYEEEHSRHVTSLALALFDDLITLHRMGSTQKKWLHFAGILHDIGYFRSEKGHQKKGLALVLADSDLPFTPRERSIIGSIVRYHGTEKPTPRHVPFGRLSHKDQRRVSMLAAILRIADALDVSHEALISRIEPELQNDRVHLHCYAPYPSPSEESAFCRKKDLFETIFQRSVEMSWRAAA